jgi:uncharacterized protein (DUF433 family)
MTTIALSETTYQLLQQQARSNDQTPDQLADELLREQLAPKHAYIQVVERLGGPQAMITDTRISVSDIVGYLRIGETPESIVEKILPHLTLAQVYDTLSYYHDHKSEIEQELAESTEEYGQAYLRERLGDEGYRRITGQAK